MVEGKGKVDCLDASQLVSLFLISSFFSFLTHMASNIPVSLSILSLFSFPYSASNPRRAVSLVQHAQRFSKTKTPMRALALSLAQNPHRLPTLTLNPLFLLVSPPPLCPLVQRLSLPRILSQRTLLHKASANVLRWAKSPSTSQSPV